MLPAGPGWGRTGPGGLCGEPQLPDWSRVKEELEQRLPPWMCQGQYEVGGTYAPYPNGKCDQEYLKGVGAEMVSLDEIRDLLVGGLWKSGRRGSQGWTCWSRDFWTPLAPHHPCWRAWRTGDRADPHPASQGDLPHGGVHPAGGPDGRNVTRKRSAPFSKPSEFLRRGRFVPETA